VNADKYRFSIRASASRLDKGLLAIPQRFRSLFPTARTAIQVIFDDGERSTPLTFQPHDAVVKENRIFGLRKWFLRRGVREGDSISITVESEPQKLYRIALDRFVLQRQEDKARSSLRSATTDLEAEQGLEKLAHITRRRPREAARGELLRMAAKSLPEPRPLIAPHPTTRREVVPAQSGSCFASFTTENANFAPSLSKSEAANRTLKFIISTRRSDIIPRISWLSVQTATLSSSTPQ
jgi:hypothetical protein